MGTVNSTYDKVKVLPEAYSYTIKCDNEKYYSEPNFSIEQSKITIEREYYHDEKYEYIRKKIQEQYANVTYTAYLTVCVYEFESRYVMEQILKKLIDLLNRVYAACHSCRIGFYYLDCCIEHKKNCPKLWTTTSTENMLIGHMDKLVKVNPGIMLYVVHKQKGIVYKYVDGKFSAGPILTVSSEDFVSKLAAHKKYETDEYVILCNKRFSDKTNSYIEKIIGKNFAN